MSTSNKFNGNLPAALEALLFVSNEPITYSDLASILGVSSKEIDAGLRYLEEGYQTRGLRMQNNNGKLQLTTAPEMAELIEYSLGFEGSNRLSRAALETLAIIAYQQPVTRPFIEGIRGVSSDGVMKSLVGKGLIQEVGRTDGPGRPIMYGTTSEFLQYFGINNLTELPPVDMIDVDGQIEPEVFKG